MAAACLPARRTARIAPVQAMRDDVALPESSLRRRLLVGIALVGRRRRPARARPVRRRPAQRLVRRRRHPRDPARRRRGQPGHQPAVPRAARAVVRTRLRHASATSPARTRCATRAGPRPPPSALMIGLALACTMAIVGDSAKATVDKSVADNFVGDYVVSNVFGGLHADIADQMAEVDGVDTVVRERYGRGQLDGDTQAVAAIDPATVDRARARRRPTATRPTSRRLRPAPAVVRRRRGSRGRRRARGRPAGGGTQHLAGRRDLRGQPGHLLPGAARRSTTSPTRASPRPTTR